MSRLDTLSASVEQAPRRADPYANTQSLEFKFRAKRFAQIQTLIEQILRERGRCDILDLGGTERYWDIGGDFIRREAHRLSITIVNNEPQAVARSGLFTFVYESATKSGLLAGRHFDLVHSNSVIEHVGDTTDMERFALNVSRLAPRYYVQTPNFWFPYEPHFRCIGFQYLPAELRARLITKVELGFFRRIAALDEAREIIAHHRLVSARQMRRFFPDARVTFEKIAGLNKSIIAIRD